jgi:hypothetical protein
MFRSSRPRARGSESSYFSHRWEQFFRPRKIPLCWEGPPRRRLGPAQLADKSFESIITHLTVENMAERDSNYSSLGLSRVEPSRGAFKVSSIRVLGFALKTQGDEQFIVCLTTFDMLNHLLNGKRQLALKMTFRRF